MLPKQNCKTSRPESHLLINIINNIKNLFFNSKIDFKTDLDFQSDYMLFYEGQKVIADHTLVAIVVMIAESHPEEKETMVNLVMNFLVHQ